MITFLEDVAFAVIIGGCLLAFTRLAWGAGWAWARRPGGPPLNPHVPMPPGPDPLAVPHGQCGCELVWRPCAIHDPAWVAEMERKLP